MAMNPFEILLRPNPIARDAPTKKMQVLCLGLSRSGTDSLCQALKQLGYNEVYHAYYLFEQRKEDAMFWVNMEKARKRHGVKPSRQDFDRMLGQCEAVTDVPCFAFAEELIHAYPDAKVIINRRQDLDAWYKSIMATIGLLVECSWPAWALSFFDTELYWVRRTAEVFWRDWAQGDFRGNAKARALQHYADLDKVVAASQIDHLQWDINEGWEPICNFLGKPVPDSPFPRGNDPGGFSARSALTMNKAVARAAQRAAIFAGVIIAVGAGLVYRFRTQ